VRIVALWDYVRLSGGCAPEGSNELSSHFGDRLHRHIEQSHGKAVKSIDTMLEQLQANSQLNGEIDFDTFEALVLAHELLRSCAP
jgi:hypothetical protein